MRRRLPHSIRDNLQFLLTEVDDQLSSYAAFIRQPDEIHARRVMERSGYGYNLKQRILTASLNHMACADSPRSTQYLRGVEYIATALDRLTELCREGVKQIQSMQKINSIDIESYRRLIKSVRHSLQCILPAMLESDSTQARKISQAGVRLATTTQQLHYDGVERLQKHPKQSSDLVKLLFVVRGLEQMAEIIQDVGESILSANIGQPINLQQYQALRSSINELGITNSSRVTVAPIAQTRSGSAISAVSKQTSEDDYLAIYKEGQKRKLKEERQGVESWHEIYPGLAPKILAYKKRGQSASLLIEHLPGLTFEQILLNEPEEHLQEALGRLMKTLRSIWQETRTEKKVRADHMGQLRKRLGDVYKIHPEFQQHPQNICGTPMMSYEESIDRAAQIEKSVKSPFSVYIHGDFNLDNVIYDPVEQKINFIDLHRSCYLDYVQDISVFMVSNYRLQILDRPTRQRIMNLATEFYGRCRRTAKKYGDDTFEVRLALGLARSFMTSTRFILDKSLARRMYIRSQYLLNHVQRFQAEKPGRYRLPVKEIFVG